MDPFITYRIAAILIIAFIYMLFDIFNNRNVPSLFAYATLVVGLIFTVTYYPALQTIEISALVAIVIGSIGYLFYKNGQVGAADVIELAAISLILPVQPAPYYLAALSQFSFPFILSVFIASGVVALIMIPIYYLPRAKAVLKRSLTKMITKTDMYRGALLLTAYVIFIGFLVFQLGIGIIGVAVLCLIMIGSVITAVFEKPITDSMIEYIGFERFEDGDIIATNLMEKAEINKMKKKVKGFDRLVTPKIIKEMKSKKIREKFPVYRKAIPLAFPIFIGVLLSLLLGNLVLIII